MTKPRGSRRRLPRFFPPNELSGSETSRAGTAAVGFRLRRGAPGSGTNR
jgi:hypothetical protein